MINKQRVRRIKNAIYIFIVAIFLLPLVLVVTVCFSMLGLMNQMSDKFTDVTTRVAAIETTLATGSNIDLAPVPAASSAPQPAASSAPAAPVPAPASSAEPVSSAPAESFAASAANPTSNIPVGTVNDSTPAQTQTPAGSAPTSSSTAATPAPIDITPHTPNTAAPAQKPTQGSSKGGEVIVNPGNYAPMTGR